MVVGTAVPVGRLAAGAAVGGMEVAVDGAAVGVGGTGKAFSAGLHPARQNRESKKPNQRPAACFVVMYPASIARTAHLGGSSPGSFS